MGEGYRAAGVDIDAGTEAVRRISPLVRATYRPEVIGDIGGFGGLFDLGRSGFDDPLLVPTCKYGASLEDQIFEPVGGGSRLRG